MFAVEDKVIALGTKKDSRRFTQQYESEAIAVFISAIEEKGVRINAVLNCASNEGEDVEYNWWTMWVGKP